MAEPTEQKLTNKQIKAMEGLLSGLDYLQASTAAGINYRTLYRWRHQPHFKKELQRRSDVMLFDASMQLKGHMEAAVSALRETLDDPQVKPAVRVRAATAILDYGLRLTDTVDIVRRIEALENSTH